MASVNQAHVRGPRTPPSSSFDRAIDRFTNSLTAKQRREFAACSLEDVYTSIVAIQDAQGTQNAMRNMARIQGFLEGMDEYRKVVEAFLNCTPFMGYVWGPIRFILLATNTWVTSLDIILNAYKQIEERLPSFMQYRALFEKSQEMRHALELYLCDVLDFHYNALKFLSRPGWKKLFASFWKTFETRFRCILDSLSRHKELIESEKTTAVLLEAQRTREIAESHYNDMRDTELKKQLSIVLEKLDAPDYQIDHYTACEQRRRSRSGEWIYRHELFCNWADAQSGKNSLLYINGVPGAGKTTLASGVIDMLLKDAKFPALYFYCRHNVLMKNTFRGVLRALLAQLSSQDNVVASFLYDRCCTRDKTSVSAILEELAEIAFNSQPTIFIVLDGLDECEPEEVENILNWFTLYQNDLSSQAKSHLRLLCVGQRTDIIQRLLSRASLICLENPDHQNDILNFVKHQAHRLRNEFDLESEVEGAIVRRVANTAKSMFLFAKLVMENLLDQTSQHDLFQELDEKVFPIDLTDAYGRVVATVFKKGPQQRAAVHIVKWIACAKRPLRWGEVQATFVIDPSAGTSDFRGRRLRKTCKHLCASLIDVSRDENGPEAEAILSLVHDTARDYLCQRDLLNLQAQNAEMALYCTEYFLSQPYNLLASEDVLYDRCKQGYYAFLDYAASYWLDHLHEGANQIFESAATEALRDRLATGIILLFHEYQIVSQHSLDDLGRDHSRLVDTIRAIPRGVYDRNQWLQFETRIMRIRRKLETIAEDHQDLPNSALVNSMLEMYGRPHYKCPKLGCVHFQEAFDSRSERDEHMNRHRRPFLCPKAHCPSQALGFSDEKALSRHLVQSHRSQEATDQPSFPHLRSTKADDIFSTVNATLNGDLDAMQRLSGFAESVNETGPDGRTTPLSLAVQNGRLDICRALIAIGAAINVKDLALAAMSNDVEILQYLLDLLDWLPDPEMHASLLHTAIAHKAETIVEFFLDKKIADPDLSDFLAPGSLRVAIQSNYPTIVKLLLATGRVDLHVRCKSGRTPLIESCSYGHSEIATRLLCTRDVDVNASDIYGRTPLWYAARNNLVAVARLLLGHEDVELDWYDEYDNTPLRVAVISGNAEIVAMLLATGRVELNRKDILGETVLAEAARAPNVSIVKMLLESGKVDVNAKSYYGVTALSRARLYGAHDVINLLLAASAVDQPEPDSRNDAPQDYQEQLMLLDQQRKKHLSLAKGVAGGNITSGSDNKEVTNAEQRRTFFRR